MNLKNLFLLLVVTVLFSCEKNDVAIDADNLLLGTWVNPVYNDETTTFKRANALPNDGYGLSFTENGNLVERTSGWCGTPPLSYFNIEGSFELDNTLVRISTQNYPTDYAWRIISLTENELVVKRELTAQEIEHRNLMDLFNEIQEWSYSVSCSNASNWLFTAYGAKACGGAQGYIAYSSRIDTSSFLNKIATYTQAEKEFNVKWGIISDCSITKAPISVVCQNGYPTLKY
ncbi:hypothetical protein [Polaribacter butkevichii]|uniref:Lipocalin-like domain-containing protein n=1 Tax=Polaribacter butkevichii TaxID=218490 RepID=A0A2P6C7I7_9FLAO|nr:hypothetical protein [Polaribacter butkevichii]PQJ68875.1 hypothetical protein BTO14_12580 [Polaribacter butkevichii]